MPQVDSARCLDAKENHKVVVKEKGKPDQKYMSLTEPLWTKSFDARAASLTSENRAATNSAMATTQIPPTTLF